MIEANEKIGSRKSDREKVVLRILGETTRSALGPSILKAAPRAKLLEACRLLGLRGTSRLRKKEVVDRLSRALQSPESAKVKKRPPLTETPAEPTIVEHAVRSRAEFEAHKYSLTDRESSAAETWEAAPPRNIPWAYGRDRVRALAVDPERLYIYWEVTDEARERSRGGLGPGGATAWLSLRIYDTTGRLFDGTNAHGYSDHRIDNGSRQRFFDIGKPESEAFVEIGMKSHEGYFVRIARSGRVTFPRRSPAPYREPQWLTVRAGSETPVATKPATGTAFEPAPQRSTRFPPVPLSPPAHDSPEGYPGIEPSVNETEGLSIRVELGEEREIERLREAPVTTRVWEAGPFTLPVNVPEPVWETYSGEVGTFEVDGRTHVVFGPWHVVVRGLGAFEERRVLSRWMVYRSFAVESGSEGPLERVGERILGSSALLGASERRLSGASELRLAGASELLYRGASDRRYAAASEKLLRGGSDRRLGGASGRR